MSRPPRYLSDADKIPPAAADADDQLINIKEACALLSICDKSFRRRLPTWRYEGLEVKLVSVRYRFWKSQILAIRSRSVIM